MWYGYGNWSSWSYAVNLSNDLILRLPRAGSLLLRSLHLTATTTRVLSIERLDLDLRQELARSLPPTYRKPGAVLGRGAEQLLDLGGVSVRDTCF